MQELLFGSWGLQAVAYTRENPWHVFAIVLVAILLLDFLLRKRPAGTGDFPDFGGLDCGGDGGDGCGD